MLSGIRITGADLRKGDFKFANCSDSHFNDTTFVNARLSGANFRGSKLTNCQFNGAIFLLANFSSTSTLTNVDVAHALFLGAKIDGELLSDDILTQQGAIHVDTAITTIEKLRIMLDQKQISTAQAEFFKHEINDTYGTINSYRIRVAQHMFVAAEWAMLAPYSTPANFQIMQDAYMMLEEHLVLEKQADNEAATMAPSI